MSKPRSLTAQGFQTLLNLITPTINPKMTAAERATSREVFVNEGLRIVRDRGFEKVCQAIAVRQAVDEIVKRRSDIRLPPVAQLELLPSIDAVEEATGEIIFEDGDKTITPFAKMIPEDWAELTRRGDEHAARVVASSVHKHEWEDRLVPFLRRGMTTAQALIEVWREAEQRRRNAA